MLQPLVFCFNQSVHIVTVDARVSLTVVQGSQNLNGAAPCWLCRGNMPCCFWLNSKTEGPQATYSFSCRAGGPSVKVITSPQKQQGKLWSVFLLKASFSSFELWQMSLLLVLSTKTYCLCSFTGLKMSFTFLLHEAQLHSSRHKL